MSQASQQELPSRRNCLSFDLVNPDFDPLRPTECFEQLLVTKRLVKERDSTGLHRLSARFFVSVSAYENDRDRAALGRQLALQL